MKHYVYLYRIGKVSIGVWRKTSRSSVCILEPSITSPLTPHTEGLLYILSDLDKWDISMTRLDATLQLPIPDVATRKDVWTVLHERLRKIRQVNHSSATQMGKLSNQEVSEILLTMIRIAAFTYISVFRAS